jgi:thioredoxin reductase (NADPH)
MTTSDVLIVGGGPAGLCAALYAGRGMLRTVLLERGATGGELLNTDLIEDYPGFPSVKGHELARLMTEHALKFGAELRQENVESIVKREGDGFFEVACTGGAVYEAPAVILTAGGRPPSSASRARWSTPAAACRTARSATAPSSRGR